MERPFTHNSTRLYWSQSRFFYSKHRRDRTLLHLCLQQWRQQGSSIATNLEQGTGSSRRLLFSIAHPIWDRTARKPTAASCYSNWNFKQKQRETKAKQRMKTKRKKHLKIWTPLLWHLSFRWLQTHFSEIERPSFRPWKLLSFKLTNNKNIMSLCRCNRLLTNLRWPH